MTSFEQSGDYKVLVTLLKQIKEKYGLSFDDAPLAVPVEIFAAGAPLACLVAWLRSQGYSVKDIASLLGRSLNTIYQVPAIVIPSSTHGETIPLSLFKNRSLSVMEIIVVFLHKERGLRFSRIAALVQKDPRTIWTSWHRALQKSV